MSSLSVFSRSKSDRNCCISLRATRLDERFEGEAMASDVRECVEELGVLLCQSTSSRVEILSLVGESDTRVTI